MNEENQGVPASSGGRATGLRPQPASQSSQSSVPNAGALLELADRIEKAEGPDRELDRLIARQQGWHRVEPRHAHNKHGAWIAPADFLGVESDGRPRLDSLHGTDMHREVPAFTASVDAALTLIPVCPQTGGEKYAVRLDSGFYGPTAELWHECSLDRFHGHSRGFHEGLPRALIAASLRAASGIEAATAGETACGLDERSEADHG